MNTFTFFRFCGYISSGDDESSPFLCHVFQCTPNAASFTKALEEACRVMYTAISIKVVHPKV